MLYSYMVECLVAVDSWAFGHLSRLPTVGPDIGQLGGGIHGRNSKFSTRAIRAGAVARLNASASLRNKVSVKSTV
jgi:hypothetical protein